VGDGGRPHIDRYDVTGQLDLRITLTNVSRAPDETIVARAQAELLASLERGGREGMVAAVAEMAAMEDAPVLRGLATDDLDRLWVRWGQQPGLDTVLYAVFDAQGILTGTATLPPHERILAIDAGRVVVLRLSPLGVETLVVYAFGA
jgi:hypothetical protein